MELPYVRIVGSLRVGYKLLNHDRGLTRFVDMIYYEHLGAGDEPAQAMHALRPSGVRDAVGLVPTMSGTRARMSVCADGGRRRRSIFPKWVRAVDAPTITVRSRGIRTTRQSCCWVRDAPFPCATQGR